MTLLRTGWRLLLGAFSATVLTLVIIYLHVRNIYSRRSPPQQDTLPGWSENL
jgi:hypothetical protein